MIPREVKSAPKEFVTTEPVTMVEESLEDIMEKLFHRAHCGIRSVV